MSKMEQGTWWTVDGRLLRYEGKKENGAYVFSKFRGVSPDDPGESASDPIEIYNLDDLSPWETLVNEGEGAEPSDKGDR